MALNIKNPEVEKLAAEVAEMERESKTEVIRRALADRKLALKAASPKPRPGSLHEYLERHVWPTIPPDVLGKKITKEEEEEILGIGPDGF